MIRHIANSLFKLCKELYLEVKLKVDALEISLLIIPCCTLCVCVFMCVYTHGEYSESKLKRINCNYHFILAGITVYFLFVFLLPDEIYFNRPEKDEFNLHSCFASMKNNYK